jgi:multidrug transporter EmrE-like cation transporter
MRGFLTSTVPFERPAVTVGLTFALALGADLASKVLAIAYDVDGNVVVYNDRPGMLTMRILMTLVALVVTYLLTRAARRLEIGRLWGAWIGVGLLAGGVLGNGISSVVWRRGVPDFIHTPAYVWNLADFEISFGVTGGIVSVAVAALSAYVRERRLPPPAHGLD